MPVSSYFDKPDNGKPGQGAAVMRAMKRRYGSKQGQRVFYATVNKMRSGTPAQQAAQPRKPGQALARARKRRRKREIQPPLSPPGQTVYGGSTTSTRSGY